MTEEVVSPGQTTMVRSGVGRTWADLALYAFFGALGAGALALLGFGIYRLFGYVPMWTVAAAASSLIFVPWMMERAKDDARLFVVVDGPMRLTEYRVGKRVPVEIEGLGLPFYSSTGVQRLVLTEFNPETLEGSGSELAEFTQFDQVRDLSTVNKLSKALESTLREDRLTMQHVGIEVEKKSREVVDWALRLIYEGTVPTELTDALGIDEPPEVDMDLNSELDEVLEA